MAGILNREKGTEVFSPGFNWVSSMSQTTATKETSVESVLEELRGRRAFFRPLPGNNGDRLIQIASPADAFTKARADAAKDARQWYSASDDGQRLREASVSNVSDHGGNIHPRGTGQRAWCHTVAHVVGQQ